MGLSDRAATVATMQTSLTRMLSFSLLLFLSMTGIVAAQEAAGSATGSGSASAGGGGRAAGIGVGAETMLGNTTIFGVGIGPNFFFPSSAAAFVYDATMWRVDALLAMDSAGATDIFAGGRFWFNLHEGTASDFAVGGGLGVLRNGDDSGNDNDTTDFLIEGGVQLRAFLVPNVAIGAMAGLGFFVLDQQDGDDFFFLGGQLLGNLGIWYFFD